mmetsp:Transcript_51980/g.147310  ORF Transcript_51980/g.147310 Transcript_51980/m.147310 type:complete len:136 (-) Transcript_51980:456-863(-)
MPKLRRLTHDTAISGVVVDESKYKISRLNMLAVWYPFMTVMEMADFCTLASSELPTLRKPLILMPVWISERNLLESKDMTVGSAMHAAGCNLAPTARLAARALLNLVERGPFEERRQPPTKRAACGRAVVGTALG